jgi:ADP-heptose:LPS heptosyltransferase
MFRMSTLEGASDSLRGQWKAVRRVALVSKLTGAFDLGDIVMSNSIVRCVRREFPASRIVLFARREEIARFRDRFYVPHSWIDEFHDCPALIGHSWKEWLRLYLRMLTLRVDLCITNIESLPAWLPFLAGIRLRVGIRPDEKYLGRMLTHPVALPAGKVHWTDIASAYAAVLAGPDKVAVRNVVPFVRYEAEPTGIREDVRRPLVVLHIGGAMHWNRRWPRESYLEICVRLTRNLRATIAVVGGHEEEAEVRWLTQRLLRLCPDARVENLGGCGLNRLLNVYAGADLYIGNDSGLMHLAVAVGLPVVAVFGPSDHRYLGPDRVDARHQVVTKDFACSRGVCPLGCQARYDIAYPEYPACLKAISVAQVWAAILRGLKTCSSP